MIITITDEALLLLGILSIVFLPQIHLLLIFLLFEIGNLLEKIGKYVMPILLFFAIYGGTKYILEGFINSI